MPWPIAKLASGIVETDVTQEKGVPYRRHKPSAAVRAFLDPLDPGLYFDCGNARLRGLDEALLREAQRRGRTIGDDSFQLVATDTGLIYCRPSIAFAIAAKWDEITMNMAGRDGPVLLEVQWPVHGPLKFTVSRRLAGNVYRRWQQLRYRRSVARSEESGEGVSVPGAPLAQVDGAPVVVELSDLDTVVDLSVSSTPSDRDSTDEFDFTPELADLRRRLDAEPQTEPATNPDPAPESETEVEVEIEVEVEAEPEVEVAEVEVELEVQAERGPEPEPEPDSETEPDSGPRPQVPDRVVIDLDWPEPEAAPVAALRRQAVMDGPSIVVAVGRESPPAWVGSPISFAATAAALSLLVVVATLTASVIRRTGAEIGSTEAMAGAAVLAGPRTTVDHQRFRPDGPSGPTTTATGGAVAPTTVSTTSASTVITSTTAASATVTSTAGLLSPNGPSTVVSPSAGSSDEAEPMTVVVPRLCEANYSGCVPVVVDVDCPDDGDGPVYLADTTVVVMGQDVYGLDTDGDGMACEADQPPLASGEGG